MFKEFTASEFKQHTGALINEVANLGEEIIITKHGKPICKVVPFEEETVASKIGWMKDTVEIHDDITKPIEDDWNANQ